LHRHLNGNVELSNWNKAPHFESFQDGWPFDKKENYVWRFAEILCSSNEINISDAHSEFDTSNEERKSDKEYVQF
jgi:hypothetical protein